MRPFDWVTNADGRNPGLLLRWDRVASGWRGYVTHPVRDGDGLDHSRSR
jgi:hypothetical protein